MNRHSYRLSRVLVLGLALMIAGCGGRKPTPKTVSDKPGAGQDAAAFDTASGSTGKVYSGDLPLGEDTPDMGRYFDAPGLEDGPGGGSGRGPGGRDAALSPEALVFFEDVLFEFDSYSLTAAAKEQLTGLGAYLRSQRGFDLLIEGHCDERGDASYNLALGEKRALIVREFLAGMRVDPGRMVTVSFGEERPLETGSDEASWARNRRAHFRVRRQ